MKIAFVGKGGSGKTTLSALFCRRLAADDAAVVAVDADINQHLAAALGAPPDIPGPPSLGSRLEEIKDYLRGSNPRISSARAMVKTTPPGRGSRLVRPGGDDPFHTRWSREVGGVHLMATGPFDAGQVGVSCYHAKIGAAELYLNHLVDGPDEYVVLDMTAGADAFSSGLFTRFDATVVIVEPTLKSVDVYHQYAAHAREFGVRLAVVGNKVTGPEDVAFLRSRAGVDLLAWIGQSGHIRALDQGRDPAQAPLEAANGAALDEVRRFVDGCPQDWPTFTRQAVDFHLRNARAWANDAVGEDLACQVDPDFVLGPAAFQAAGAGRLLATAG